MVNKFVVMQCLFVQASFMYKRFIIIRTLTNRIITISNNLNKPGFLLGINLKNRLS